MERGANRTDRGAERARTGDRDGITPPGPELGDVAEHLVRGIVTRPDDVQVDVRSSRRGTTVKVRVHADDVGKVIGRAGRTATAIRTVVNAVGGEDAVRVDIVGLDER